MKKKIGIMGGTFDPIHIGHLILGEAAFQQFGLDKVLFMPSGNPPHKPGRQGASNDDRVNMVSLAIAGNPHFELSLEEMHQYGYIYTSKTLRRLTEAHPDCEYYFIMGADSLYAFDTWRDPEVICQHAILVAAIRDHLPTEELDQKIIEVSARYHGDIRKLQTLNIDISSQTIRQWVKEEKSCRYYLTDPVIDYIRKHQLYKD